MELTPTQVQAAQAKYAANSKQNALALGIARNGIVESAESPVAWAESRPHFSVELTTGPVPNQRHSGRCWLFATMNLAAEAVAKSLQAPVFELSQNYLFFYDKLEKANYFYENILNTADRPVDDRTVAWLLDKPADDGGQWDMVVGLLQKYGVVPQEVMPDTENAKSSDDLNKYLKAKLRLDARVLRDMVANGESDQAIAAKRTACLEQIYAYLAMSLGTPPSRFDFEYTDSTGAFHRLTDQTGPQFFAAHVGLDLTDYVPVIDAPMANKPYGRPYTVDCLGSVVGGQPIKYLNLPIDALKRAAIAQLQAGEGVWFGSDIGQMTNRDAGIMSTHTYDLGNLFDIDWSSTKAERLTYHHSLLTHAMVLTGVDLNDAGQPVKWKVQNSWGDKVGHKGYFVMTDDWFSDYVYQVVVRREFLTADEQAQFTQPATVLPAWDPMGSLA